MLYRTEKDALGEVQVPADRHYGAQTQRSLYNFPIGIEKMPMELVYALVLVKKAAASINAEVGVLTYAKKEAIVQVCDEILSGKFEARIGLSAFLAEFPLSVWQTGSGTHTNMNVNEVISNLAIEKLKNDQRSTSIQPNDDVNMSQSTNDVFPTAMHMAAVKMVKERLLPSLKKLRDALHDKACAFNDVIKTGRTHLMDATPITLGQEFSGYVSQLDHAQQAVEATLPALLELAVGGTAVGTGINAPPQFGEKVCRLLASFSGFSFVSAPNKFAKMAAQDSSVATSGALKVVACALMKIANDIRWMASGPRCGLGELFFIANEPGSSIMPGKVNPSQCEAVTMVVAQVMGNDATIAFAGSQGNFELNVFMPVIAYNLLNSIRLLADAADSFSQRCVVGLTPNYKNIQKHLDNSLMLVTALNPHIGYDKAGQIACKAYNEGSSLKQAALALGFLDEKSFDAIMDPKKMINS